MAAQLIDLKDYPKVAQFLQTTFVHANPKYVPSDRVFKLLSKYYDLRYNIYPNPDRNGTITLSISYTLDNEEISFTTHYRSYEDATRGLLVKLTNFIKQLEKELIVT